MIFTNDNVNDIRRYYQGSYVKFRDLGDVICHIENVGINTVEGERVICVTGTTSTNDLFTIPLWHDQPYEVEYVLPKKGFFLYKDKLHQLRRVPARQYSRGICMDNTSIVRIERNGTYAGADLTAEILQAYVNKPDIKFPSLADLKKTTPILLSRRIAITPATGRVLVDMNTVGETHGESVRVDALFYPELSSLLKGSDIKVEVK
jgi:hypothetical protein